MWILFDTMLAIICIAIGFGLGTMMILWYYDDGLEMIMDVYNYFKNPPRS